MCVRLCVPMRWGEGRERSLHSQRQAWPAAQTAHMRIWSCFKSAQSGQTLPGHAAVRGQATPVPAARGSARVPLPTARAAPTSGRGIGKLTQCAGPAHRAAPLPAVPEQDPPMMATSHTPPTVALLVHAALVGVLVSLAELLHWVLRLLLRLLVAGVRGGLLHLRPVRRACVCVTCVHVCVLRACVCPSVGWGGVGRGARAPKRPQHRGATHVVPGRHALLALLVRACRLRVGDRLLDGRLAGLRGERGEKRARGCHRGGNFLRSHAHGGRRPTRHPPAATANAHAPARRAAGWAAPRARSARAWGRAGRRRWAWPPSCWCGP